MLLPENPLSKEIKSGTKVMKEDTKRGTIDIPISMFKEIKRYLINDEHTMKDYLFGLMEKDLKSRKYGLDQTEFL